MFNIKKEKFTIKKGKKDKCPICLKQINNKNRWVRFHVRYNPQIVVIACKWCNFTEWVLRNNIEHRNYGVITPYRINRVIQFQNKFGVNL